MSFCGKKQPPGSRRQCPLQCGIVRQFVVKDQVSRAEQVADRGDVGGVPADEHDAVLAVEHRSEGGLEGTLHLPFARRDAARRHRSSVAVDGRPASTEAVAGRPENGPERPGLDRIADRRSGAVGFGVGHMVRLDAEAVVNVADQRLLGAGIGHGDALRPPVLVDLRHSHISIRRCFLR